MSQFNIQSCLSLCSFINYSSPGQYGLVWKLIQLPAEQVGTVQPSAVRLGKVHFPHTSPASIAAELRSGLARLFEDVTAQVTLPLD